MRSSRVYAVSTEFERRNAFGRPRQRMFVTLFYHSSDGYTIAPALVAVNDWRKRSYRARRNWMTKMFNRVDVTFEFRRIQHA